MNRKKMPSKKDVGKKPGKGNKTRNLRARAGEKVVASCSALCWAGGVVKSYHIKV